MASTLLAVAAQGGTEGFVAVDPASIDSVSGTTLVTVAYGAILGVLALYALVLMLRDRAVRRAAERLRERLDASSG